MDELPQWAKWVQAVTLLFIALVGARIAYGQWDVSRSKLKLDLFDRRFALYLVAAKFLSNVLQEGNASNGAINQYSREILDAEFLTSKAIYEYLSEIREKAVKLHAYHAQMERMSPSDERTQLEHKHQQVWDWFKVQHDVLKNKFLPLIGFEKMRWGPPSWYM